MALLLPQGQSGKLPEHVLGNHTAESRSQRGRCPSRSLTFLNCLKFQITSRREFDRLSRTDPTTLTDLERAARFLYLQRTAFGGKVAGQNFGVAFEREARFNITTLKLR